MIDSLPFSKHALILLNKAALSNVPTVMAHLLSVELIMFHFSPRLTELIGQLSGLPNSLEQTTLIVNLFLLFTGCLLL
jgi:hypothetical protein